MASEFSITFSGAGGHDHSGLSGNGSLISTTSYSIFDWNTSTLGSQTRIARQVQNKINLENWIVNLLETRPFSPKILKLQPSSLNGKIIVDGTLQASKIVAGSITGPLLADGSVSGVNIVANTITGEKIQNNAIGSDQINNIMSIINLQSDFVTTNATMKSTDYNGTTPGTGSAGWSLWANGDAEFNDVYVRGTVVTQLGQIASFTFDADKIEGSVINTDGITYSVNSATSMSKYEFKSQSDYEDYINDYNFITSAYIRGDVLYPGLYITRQTYSISTGFFISSAGYSYTVNGPQSFSDIRLKNIYNEDFDALGILNNLDLIVYSFKNDTTNEKKLGFSAQQAHNLIPNFSIPGGEDPEKEPWQIVKENLIPYLAKSIQQLSEKVDYLEARVQTLEGV